MIEAGSSFFVDFTVVTLGAFTVGMILEMLVPAREGLISISRWLNNSVLALVTYACNHLFATFVAVFILYSFEPRLFTGLTNLPLWLDATIAFLALELTRYGIHVAMHKLPILWRFHAVHHADSAVDVFTSFRHHPIEAMLGAVPITAVVWLLASAPEVLILYRAWDLIMTVMTHTNIAIPNRFERWLRFIVVTPAFHRTHHLAEKRFTDSNYSNSVPWFDYFFSTYQPTTVEQQKFAKIGLETHTNNEQRVDGMLYAPFMKRENEPE
jgi:sterol desaturase/sphingolipid hydroxylase (fatty acid hydroxylase superfamily)